MSQSLSIAVEHADGSVTRWGAEEDGTAIPNDLTFSTSMPGGFATMTCSLLRRIDQDFPDQNLFDTVKVMGAGNNVVFEGRIAQLPRSHGQGQSITPGAVGWSAHLRDDPSFGEVYVDRDLASWEDISNTRRAFLSTTAFKLGDPFTGNTTGAISFNVTPGAPIKQNTVEERWWRGPAGVDAGVFQYQGLDTNMVGEAATLFSGVTENAAASAGALTLDDVLRSLTLSTAARYLMLRAAYTAAASTTNDQTIERRYSSVAVYGNHGLTLRENGTDPYGVYASDVIEDIVTRAAPMLTIGRIDATSFVIPHLVFKDPVTAEDAILSVNAYHLFDWAIWEDRTFSWTQPDDSEPWQARLSDGAHLELEGDQAEDVYNGVIVSYTEPDGTRRTVGPASATNVDATDAALEDTSSTNPVNAHGIPRRWKKLDISVVTTEAAAIQLGSIWLAENSAPARRGTLTLTGTVEHPTKGLRPTYEVRAGQYVSIADHPASDPRKILETSYTHDQRQVRLTLDSSAHRLDAMLERLGVSIVGI